MTSSSVSSRASLPATSALVIAVSTIRIVEDRTSSRALMAAVRSVRRRSLRVLMRAIVSVWPGATHTHCRRPGGRRGGRRHGADGVRRLGGPAVHPASRRGPAAARRGTPAQGAAPERHPHDARAAAQAGVAERAGAAPPRPGRQHRRQPVAPRLRPGRDVLPGRAARRARRLRLRLQRLLRAEPAQPVRLPAARRPASGTRTSRSCPGPTCATPSPRPAGRTSPTGGTRSRSAT